MSFIPTNWYSIANKTKEERKAKYSVFKKYGLSAEVARHERDIHTSQLIRIWAENKALVFELALTYELR